MSSVSLDLPIIRGIWFSVAGGEFFNLLLLVPILGLRLLVLVAFLGAAGSGEFFDFFVVVAFLRATAGRELFDFFVVGTLRGMIGVAGGGEGFHFLPVLGVGGGGGGGVFVAAGCGAGS